MGFPPSIEGKCVPNYRVVKGPCWGKRLLNYGTESIPQYQSRAFACKTAETCCVDYFQVCIVNGKRVVRQREAEPGETPSLPTNVVCDGISLSPSLDVVGPEDPYACHPVCGGVPPSQE